MFDPTISLGNVLTVAGFACTAIIAVMQIKGSNDVVAAKLDLTAKQNDFRFLNIDAQVDDFKVEIQKLGELLIQLTRAEGRMNTADDRILAQGKRMDELASDVRALLREQGGK